MQYKAAENSAFLDIDDHALAQHDIKITTVLDGIQAAVSQETQILFAKGCDHLSKDTAGFDEAVNVAQEADAVVLVLGDRSGLTPDCTAGETRDSADLKLPGEQEELALAILGTGKPVAIVLITGRPYVLSAFSERANAILEAWLPGEEGGCGGCRYPVRGCYSGWEAADHLPALGWTGCRCTIMPSHRGRDPTGMGIMSPKK